MKNNNKRLNIFLTNFDWSDLVNKNPDNIIAKLNRDKLHPEKNNFLILSWGPGRYDKNIRSNIKIVRRSARFRMFRPLYDVFTWFIALRVVRKFKFNPDIIMAYDFPFTLALSRTARVLKKPLILCLTNLPRDYINSRNSLRLAKIWYQKFVENFAVIKINALYTINEVTRKYAEKVGIPKNKSVIFTVDTITQDYEIINSAKSGKAKKRLGIPDSHKILFTAARLEGEKGLHRLIQAVASLNRSDISLIIAGRGDLEHKLEEEARQLGIINRIYFVGYISRSEYWETMKDADVFILLSYAEALGIVFWEAMYLKVPTIGSRASGILESIGEKEERGFLWEPEDGIESLSERIELCFSGKVQEKIIRAKEYVNRRLLDNNDIFKLFEICQEGESV